jgi:hypothetical protein
MNSSMAERRFVKPRIESSILSSSAKKMFDAGEFDSDGIRYQSRSLINKWTSNSMVECWIEKPVAQVRILFCPQHKY